MYLPLTALGRTGAKSCGLQLIFDVGFNGHFENANRVANAKTVQDIVLDHLTDLFGADAQECGALIHCQHIGSGGEVAHDLHPPL